MAKRWGGGAAIVAAATVMSGQQPPKSAPFPWPEGKQAAISLTFDDARLSHPDVGLRLFEKLGAKVTFYVVPKAVEKRLEGWKRIVAAGHEIGNHSLNHPCSGNFAFSRDHALEDYNLETMRRELQAANQRIQDLLGVTPTSFAYPCGQKFVGRGEAVQSYVPLVAALFQSGRGWLDEGPNDPSFCDMAQITGMESDGKTWEQMRPIVEKARKDGAWLVLAGHEIGDKAAPQTTRVSMLKRLVPYCRDPKNGLWLAPVGEIARYVRSHRGSGAPLPSSRGTRDLL